jgi:hypothetical protein
MSRSRCHSGRAGGSIRYIAQFPGPPSNLRLYPFSALSFVCSYSASSSVQITEPLPTSRKQRDVTFDHTDRKLEVVFYSFGLPDLLVFFRRCFLVALRTVLLPRVFLGRLSLLVGIISPLNPHIRDSPFCRSRLGHFTIAFCEHTRRCYIRNRRLHLVPPSANDIAIAPHHCLEPRFWPQPLDRLSLLALLWCPSCRRAQKTRSRLPLALNM